MSKHPNHRRGERRRTDNGSTHEGDPNDGGRGIRRARRSWKRIGAREERRNGQRRRAWYMTGGGGRPKPRPSFEE